MTYIVRNRITGAEKICKSKASARRLQDKWDREYGGYVASVRPIEDK